MIKVCGVINKKKYPDRFISLEENLKLLKEIRFNIYDSIYDDSEKIIDWSGYDILLLHQSDIEVDEAAFNDSVEKYTGNTIFFTGGISGVNRLNEHVYEFNYTILINNFHQILNDVITNTIVVEKYNIIEFPTNYLKQYADSLVSHEKLSNEQFSDIIQCLNSMQLSKILFVDDSIKPDFINRPLEKITISNSFEKAIEIAKDNKFVFAVVDYDLKSKNGNGIDLSKILIKENPKIKILFLTGKDDFDTVFKSFSVGINHFVSKQNFCIGYFRSVVDLIEFDYAPFILGKSKAVLDMFQRVSFYSKLSDDILITGENGTGKELVAQSLYFLGRYKGKMISKNCSGIPETLFESEMFGYKEGAFTGALKSGRISPFEESENGILFLDEVGELPQAQQVKLLRVIQDRQVTHLGSNITSRFNARLVFATNKDLLSEINNKNFRQDFYYRISGSEILVPPLRERKEDIELLTAFFAYKFFTRNKQYSSLNLQIDKDSLKQIIEYKFPGNIRELEKIVNRSLVEMLLKKKNILKMIVPAAAKNSQDNSSGIKGINIENIIGLLENETILSKGLNDDLKREIINFLVAKEYSSKTIAKLFSLNEQSFKNLRSKLKI